MSDAPVHLRKLLGRGDVLAIAFGAMVGWSWVVLAGEMILRAGAVGSILAFGAGAVMVWLVGLTYAELSSALSRAGGEISFTFVALGPGGAFVCGWTLVLAYVAVCAFEAVALPTVVSYLFPGFEAGSLYAVAGWEVHASWVLVGVAGAVVIGVVNYRGIRFAAFAQRLAVGSLLLVGLAFFLPGTVRGDTANLAPWITGWEGVLRVVIMTPFLYVGFDVIPQLAEEIDVPFRTIGRIIVVSILMALGWYGLVQWTVGLALDPATLAGRALPTADAMSAVYGSPWAGRVLVVGGAFGILTSWNAFFLGASRLLFAMARGGMLPAVFARLHPRYGSPVAVVVVLTGITVVAPFFGRPALVWLVDAGSLATVVAYLLVAAAFLIIRRRHPDLPRPYRVAAPGLVGWLAVAATVFFVLLYLPGSPSALVWPEEWAIVLLWTGLGAACAVGMRGRVAALGAGRQARLILGDHAGLLGLGREATMVAREWLEMGDARVSPVDRLTDYWRAFNNLYSSVTGHPESRRILDYLEQSVSEERAEAILQERQEQAHYLLSVPVIDMRRNGRDTSGCIEEFKSAGSSLEKLRQLFMVIYQVRCNLEHGQKSPTDDRDVRLCQAAGPVVADVVRINT